VSAGVRECESAKWVFAEFRAHGMLVSAGETGSVPITFGVSF
jgi:hypothetical protein